MKTTFLFFISILFGLSLSAQYAGDGFYVTPVLCDTSDWFKDMLPNPDGSFYLVGDDTLQYKGSYDTIRNAVIAKYNADYTLAWRKEYGGSGWDGFEKIYPYLNGTMLVMGYTTSTDGDVPYGYQYTGRDVWIVIIDSNGNITHGNSWGYGNGSFGVDLSVTKSGKIFIVGQTAANLGDFAANTCPFLTEQPFVILADSQLNKIWVKVIVDNAGNRPYGCTLKNDTLILPLSIYPNSTGEFNFGTPKGNTDAAIFYIDSNQSIQRKLRLGGTNFDGIEGIQSHGDSIIMLVATSSMDGDFFSNDIPATNTSSDWKSFCNLRSDGQISWNHSFGSFGSNGTFPTNSLYSYFFRSSKNLYSYGVVAGRDDDWIGCSPGSDPNSGYEDGMLWQFDTLGVLKRKLRIGDAQPDGIVFLRENKDNKAIIGVLAEVVGASNNPFTCAVNKNLRSIRLFELSEWADAITEYVKGKGEIKIFPNPAKEELVIEMDIPFSGNQLFEVEVYTENGLRIEKKSFSKRKFSLDVTKYKNGTYFIQIIKGNELYKSKFIIQH